MVFTCPLPAPAIGIDLGTTFSSAAVYRNGKTEVIADKEGERLIPSCVFYDNDSMDVFVGNTAEEKGLRGIQNCIYDVKRIIGRKHEDAYVQKLKKAKTYKFNIVQGEDDKAEISLVHDGLRVSKTPEQVSSEILRYLRVASSEYLGADVTEAVISVPARFSNAQRKATRDAAQLAGFKVLKLITEPVAAAIHYCEDRIQTKGHLLVIDFGGGTLDVSIINVEEQAFAVKSIEGDTFLGGRDFDELLLEHFEKQIRNRHGHVQFSDRFLSRLKHNVIRTKCKLSTLNKYDFPIEFLAGKENIDFEISMTRALFEELISDLITRCLDLIRKCLTEAGLSTNDIEEVILVGGSTRIPKLREKIRTFFHGKQLKTDLNPDESVALGAAIQAALIKREFKEFEKYKITEVTPLSIGLSSQYDYCDMFILKNTRLPYKSIPISRVTVANDQDTVEFKVYEGERKICKYNNFLGSFEINNLPPGKAGKISFEVTFSLDEDGILKVEAYETITKNKNKLVVTIGGYGMCDYKIRHSVEDANANIQEDNEFVILAKYKSDIKTVYNHIIYDIGKVSNKTDKEFLKLKCDTLISNLDTITEIEQHRREYESFRDIVKPIVTKYNLDVTMKSM